MHNRTDTAAGIDAGYKYQVGSGKHLDDMLNMNALSRMIEDFCSVTGLMVDIIDRKSGEIVIAEGMQKVCATFHRDCPASELSCKSAMDMRRDDSQPVSIKTNCDLGLSMAFSSVTVAGEVVADMFIGPVLLAPVTLDQMKAVAKTVGIDAGSYHRLMGEVSVVGPADLQKALCGLTEAVRLLAEAGSDEEAKTLAAYKALFMAKRGLLKDS